MNPVHSFWAIIFLWKRAWKEVEVCGSKRGERTYHRIRILCVRSETFWSG